MTIYSKSRRYVVQAASPDLLDSLRNEILDTAFDLKRAHLEDEQLASLRSSRRLNQLIRNLRQLLEEFGDS